MPILGLVYCRQFFGWDSKIAGGNFSGTTYLPLSVTKFRAEFLYEKRIFLSPTSQGVFFFLFSFSQVPLRHNLILPVLVILTKIE